MTMLVMIFASETLKNHQVGTMLGVWCYHNFGGISHAT